MQSEDDLVMTGQSLQHQLCYSLMLTLQAQDDFYIMVQPEANLKGQDDFYISYGTISY